MNNPKYLCNLEVNPDSIKMISANTHPKEEKRRTKKHK